MASTQFGRSLSGSYSLTNCWQILRTRWLEIIFFSEALDPSFWGTYRIKEKMHYLILLLQTVSYMVELELGLTLRQRSILRTYLITLVNLLSCRLALNRIKRSLKRKNRQHKKSEMVDMFIINISHIQYLFWVRLSGLASVLDLDLWNCLPWYISVISNDCVLLIV